MDNEIIQFFFNLEKFEASEYDEWGKDIPEVNYEEGKAKLFRGINRLEIKEKVDENLMILFS